MDWEKAKIWKEDANADKNDYLEPVWSWDCGLKLDFDGPLMSISSRFYQINDDIFSGSVSILIGGDNLHEREFTGKHITFLKNQVEEYVESVRGKLTNHLKKLMDENPFI